MLMRYIIGILALTVLVYGNVLAQTETDGQGTLSESVQEEGWFCPWCDYLEQTDMGEVRTQSPEQVREYGYTGELVLQLGAQGERIDTPLDQQEAQLLAQEYIAGETGITVDDVQPQGDTYLVRVVDDQGDEVGLYQIDQQTGWFKRMEREE